MTKKPGRKNPGPVEKGRRTVTGNEHLLYDVDFRRRPASAALAINNPTLQTLVTNFIDSKAKKLAERLAGLRKP